MVTNGLTLNCVCGSCYDHVHKQRSIGFYVATRHSHKPTKTLTIRCYSFFLNLHASPECVYVTLDTPQSSTLSLQTDDPLLYN